MAKSEKAGEKVALHERNAHRQRYAFPALVAACPELAAFVGVNEHGIETIDFAKPAAVEALNRALLKHHYGVAHWGLPKGYLCPPIPGRADYVHYLADLLAEDREEKGWLPKGSGVHVLDIGTGANCVYPIIGCREYGWSFVGTETDSVALKNAKAIVEANPCLKGHIDLRLQKQPDYIFAGVLRAGDRFDISMSNPPFHNSMEEAEEGTMRKLRNLGGKARPEKVLNFGGKESELCYPGGEAGFVARMIEESATCPKSVKWFTSLVSSSESLPVIEEELKRVKPVTTRIVQMAQGQKKSRFVAWTFMTRAERRRPEAAGLGARG